MDEEQEHKERPRPRVVDKRVSSRASDPVAPIGAPAPERDTEHAGTPSPASAPSGPPSTHSAPTGGTPTSAPSPTGGTTASAPQGGGPQGGGPGGVWTPEQEAEMRAMAQHITETPSLEWVLNTAVTLANVAGTKLDMGAVADAQLAIDGLGALVDGLAGRLGNAEAPLRQTLAQLRMAYAEMVAPPTSP